MEVLKYGISISGLTLHDRFILATALKVDATFISKDKEMLKNYGVYVIW